MQRRKVESFSSDEKNALAGSIITNSGSEGASSTSSQAIDRLKPSGSPGKGSKQSRSSSPNTSANLWIFFVALVLVTGVTMMAPNEVRNVEDAIAKDVSGMEQALSDWLAHHQDAAAAVGSSSSTRTNTKTKHSSSTSASGGSNVNPGEKTDSSAPNQKQNRLEDTTTTENRSDYMENQPSRWVDSERKLKQKLLALQERQEKGVDIGVPVLTRWLGEDMPGWPSGTDADKAEWERKRDARYEEMVIEENEWKAHARQFLEAEAKLKAARAGLVSQQKH